MRLKLLLLLLLVFGCHPVSDDTTLELRTYDVPKGTVRALSYSLQNTLYVNDQKAVGRATVTPNGRLVVLAPRNIQANVQQLVDEVAQHPPTYENTIELHYWVIIGKPAASPQPPPAGAAEIQPALDEIVRAQGPQEFTIGHQFRLASLHDEKSAMEGDGLKVIQTAVQTNDGIYARILIDYHQHNKLETQMRLLPDKLVVLGSNVQKGGDAPDGTTLYYVVRVAPLVDGTKR